MKTNNHSWNYNSVEKLCVMCNKPFLVPKSHAQKKICCSTSCSGKYKTKRFKDAIFGKKLKLCYRCKKELPLSEFHKHNQKPDGLCPFCKKCHKERNQEYIERNRENIRVKRRDYMRKYRIGGKNGYVGVKNKRDYPKDNKCELCKESVRLVYHHWDDSNFSKGMWICTKCHVAAHWLEKYNPNAFYDLKNQLSQ